MNENIEKSETHSWIGLNLPFRRIPTVLLNLRINNSTHCNLTCQSKSRCFELIGYPNWWNPTKHQNSTRPSHATIAQKMEVIAFPKSLALLPTIDIGGKAFTTFMPLLNRAWMIDSGITNRMRFDVRQVSNFYSSFQNCVSTSP